MIMYMETVPGHITIIPPKHINIIPLLKELSQGRVTTITSSDKCGTATLENCVADWYTEYIGIEGMGEKTKSEKIIKRNNYTDGKDKHPNHFLWDTNEHYGAPESLSDIFQVEETELTIKQYGENWKHLFETISNLVKNSDLVIKNVFICAHQHLLLEKFFHFIKDNKKQFRNCCCIKVEIDTDGNVSFNVFYQGELPLIEQKKGEIDIKFHERKQKIEREREKKYLNKDEKLSGLLELDTFPSKLDTFPSKTSLENLKGISIYMIRHGEGWHNVINLGIRVAKNILYSKMYLNAMLTSEGVRQAQKLNEVFGNEVLGQPSIYISSPLDRAIETLITAVGEFPLLKDRFKLLRKKRYGEEAIAAVEDNSTSNPQSVEGGKRKTMKGKRTKKSKKNKRMNMKKSKKNHKNKTRGAR